MAGELDAMLNPGEKIVYRAERRLYPDSVFVDLVGGYLIPLAFIAVSGLLNFDWVDAAMIAAALAGPSIYAVFYYIGGGSQEAIVTERRLLYRSGWLRPKTFKLALSDISSVRVCWDHLRLIYSDGTSLGLGHPQLCGALGLAITYAASLSAPRPSTGWERFANWVSLVCAQTMGIVVAIVVLRIFYLDFAELHESHGMFLAAAGFLFLGLVCHVCGSTLGLYGSLGFLRVILTYDEMKEWIQNSEAFWDMKGTVSSTKLPDDMSWWILHLLYGRLPPSRSGGGTASPA